MGDQQEERLKFPVPEGYVPPEPGLEIEGRPRCAAWARQTGKPCMKIPGWGTDHPGQGRCRLHGGKAPILHGRYSKVVRPELERHLREIEASGSPLDAEPELQFLRAMLRRFMEANQEKLATGAMDSLGELGVVTKLIDQVGRQIGRIERQRALAALSLEELRVLVRRLAAVVERVVQDPIKLSSIAQEWQALLEDVQGKSQSAEGARAAFAAGEEA